VVGVALMVVVVAVVVGIELAQHKLFCLELLIQ
jgi:hypothetical protein